MDMDQRERWTFIKATKIKNKNIYFALFFPKFRIHYTGVILSVEPKPASPR